MSTSHSTGPSTARNKPAKPYPTFPLFAHATGRWCKKIRGKLHYFGPWSDPDGALAKYEAEKESLHAGRKPRPDNETATVKDVANAFLRAKKALMLNSELSRRTFDEYRRATDLVVLGLGKQRLAADVGPDDFASLRKRMARTWGPTRLGNMIQSVRSIFKHGLEAGLLDRPARFGPGFKRPTKKTIRLLRAAKGAKLFTAEEVRALADGALVVGADGPELVEPGIQIRAMILLGINCGFGNSDCGNLPIDAVDLKAGWIDFPRPKTGIARKCALWSETVQALDDALAKRPTPKNAEDAGLVFITKYGTGWAKDTPTSPLSHEVSKLLRAIGIKGRKGLNFYTLRHVFRTVADEARDQPAADYIMGHESPHMSTVYRERISDERLQAVAQHVRKWLFG